MQEIARECGYHPSTISLALRKHPSIPEDTREKIRRIATDMGYRPDPGLASLVAYRRSKQNSPPGTVIAVIVDSPANASSWRTGHPCYSAYWQGMCEQAAALGYGLSEFSIGFHRERTEQVQSVLAARGISSVIVAPLQNTDLSVDLDWQRLSAVTIGFSLSEPLLPRVSHAHHFGTMQAVDELYKLGYRRIALFLPQGFDVRVHHGWSAGFLSACNQYGIEPLLHTPPRRDPAPDGREFRTWLERMRPDVILTARYQVLRNLRSLGYSVPGDIGYAFLDCEPSRPEISGINQNSIEIGRQAVTTVANAFVNYVQGVPEVQANHLFAGTWHPGTTVCKQER